MNENRIEKKFVLGKYEDDSIKKLLTINGFKKFFPSRYISSIYLDTFNFDFAKDNINGVSKRKKLRFRWYNEDYENIYLEEKNKQNFVVKKNIDLVKDVQSKDNLIESLKDYFFIKNKK